MNSKKPLMPQTAARIPGAGLLSLRTLLAGAMVCAVIVTISACGGAGDGGSGNDPYAQWGGMSKEEWLKQREERRKKEKREEEEARKKTEAEKQAQQAAKQEKAKKQAEAQAAALATKSKPEPSASGRQFSGDPKQQLPATESPRPEAFSDWKDIDFFEARILDDPRLLPAAEYYGQHHVGDEAAADVLIQLLKPRILAGVRDRISAPKRKQDELNDRHKLLTQTLVAALGANGTAKGRQALEELIDGSFRTEFDQVAADAAVKALVDNQSPEHEEILFRVLTSADQMRPPGMGEVTARALCERAVGLLKSGASSRFRVRLAEGLVGPATPLEAQKLFEEIIREPTTANFEAHAVLYFDHRVDTELKAEIEREFVRYGSEAMGYMLSFPEQRSRFSSTPDWPYQVAQRLWSPRVPLLIESRVRAAKTLAEINQVILLGSTVPTTAMRELLLETFVRYWTDGPSALRTAGLAGDVVHEPGFYPVVKMLLRDAEAGRTALSEAIPRGRLNALGDLVKQRQQRDAKVREEWEEAAQDLLLATFGRYREMGQAHADAMRREGKPVDFDHATKHLPVDLPPGARVVAAVHYRWPAGIAEKVSGVLCSPMDIHYARIDARGEPEKIAGAYRRKLSGYELRNVPQGVWFDSLKNGSSPGRKVSVDVVVRLARPDPLRLPNEEQELTVDVLTVELDEPIGGR